jgi:hypothetical protein
MASSARRGRDMVQSLEVVDGFEMIFRRLPTSRNAVLDHDPRFTGVQRVPFDGVSRVGQCDDVGGG